jgi:hypothetical protein
MAKKKDKNKETTIENYYDLKTKEVDELVAALKDGSSLPNDEKITTNISQITGEAEKVGGSKKSKEFDPYKRDKLSALPTWLKAVFIKWWFAGCVCYFIMMGLGTYITNTEDLMIITGVFLGLIVDILVNPIFRYMESDLHEYNSYMMFPFPFKKYWTLLTNLIYYLGVMMIVGLAYDGLNAVAHLFGASFNIYVEPLLFGTFCVIVDMAFIGIKDLIVFLVKKRKKINKEEEVNV